MRIDKKTIKEDIKKELRNSLIKYCVWTLPLAIIIFVAGAFYNNILCPPLKVYNIDISVTDNLQVLSETNTKLPGRQFQIGENGEKKQEKYCAPQMSIAVKGKGKIRDAYIIYDQNDSLLVQKVGEIKNKLAPFSSKAETFDVIVNYTLPENEAEKRLYVVLVDKKDSTRHIWCVYVNDEEKSAESMCAEDIFESVLYEDKDNKFSLQKEKIQQDISDIYQLRL